MARTPAALDAGVLGAVRMVVDARDRPVTLTLAHLAADAPGLRAITPGTAPEGANAQSLPSEIPHGPAASRVPSHVAEGAVPTMQNEGNHVAPTELVPWYIIASKLALALGTSLAMIGGA